MLLKIVVSIVLLFTVLVLVRLVHLSLTSKAPDMSLVNGALRPCPATPNCVSSEANDESKSIAAFTFESSADQAWQKLQHAIEESGGIITHADETYLQAGYTTRIFHFVDDMEFRLVSDEKKIHVRSGSRVGKSDLGVNRKNVEKVRRLFNQENAFYDSKAKAY
ncbi:MAG: DUF1499 domain-containing protein [Pseudomonadota bacterium]|nr:DUF1499 domain-containing protein [Pseudomonadota bacterium]